MIGGLEFNEMRVAICVICLITDRTGLIEAALITAATELSGGCSSACITVWIHGHYGIVWMAFLNVILAPYAIQPMDANRVLSVRSIELIRNVSVDANQPCFSFKLKSDRVL